MRGMAIPFGEKTAWCAFQSTNVERVCEVLFEDRKPRVVAWDEGVDAAYRWPTRGYANVLVTPPIDGFVLAMTQGWLGWWPGGDAIAAALERDGDNAGEILTRASEWGGALECDAQFFASHREFDFDGWGRVRFTENDDDTRMFVHSLGELTQSIGTVTDEERALVASLHAAWEPFGYEDAEHLAARLESEREELLELEKQGAIELRGELDTIAALRLISDPARVAARWSVDPNTLDERSDLPGTCWLGELHV